MEWWDRAGRVGAYGAAVALTPYALIKVSWVIGALLGLLPVGDGFGAVEWMVLNTATIGMAGAGIAVALALVRPWGLRIPGAPLVFCAWVGTGFLVPVLPYALFTSLLGSAGSDPGGSGGDDPSMPGWEAALIQAGFVGMGLGLAVALPAHLRRRRAEAFAGRLGDRAGGPARVSSWVACAGAAIGLVRLYWAAGGTAGISHPAARDLGGRVPAGLSGGWALLASAGIWALAHGRPARLPRWAPLAIGWLGSGSLFAWSGWKLPFTLYLAFSQPAGTVLPENLAAAAVLHVGAIVTGAVMLRSLLSPRTDVAPTATATGNGTRAGT